VIREILSSRPARRSTDLEGALEYLTQVMPRRVVGFIISDFLDEGFGDRLAVAARRHDLTAVAVADRRETELPRIGMLELEDAETGELLLVDTYDRNVTDGLALLSRQERKERSDLFRSAGVGEVRLSADDDSYVDALVRYFHARERRR
jgi:hypothetical protein